MNQNKDEIIYEENNVLAEELVHLQEVVGFGKADVAQAGKALQNSLYAVAARVNGEIVGMGRVIGDGARIFYLQDVFIDPRFQRRGIGREIVNRLVAYVKANACKGAVTSIGLMAAKGKEDFYAPFGFRIRPNETQGPGMLYVFTE